MTDVIVGNPLGLAIDFLDQAGQPMAVTPTVDAPPAWSNAHPEVETLTVDADGMTATATAVAVGADTVSLSLSVGGVAFAATLDVNVVPLPQVLTSIAIRAVVK